MKIEKKLVVLSVFAIALGIVAVTPLAVLMNANAQTSQPYGESVKAYGEPWLDLEIIGAYFTIDLFNGEHMRTDMLRYETSLNDNALNHQPEARIEYFEATFYGDAIELLKKTFSISAIDLSNMPLPTFPNELFTFCNEYMLNCSTLGINGNFSTPHDLRETTYSSGFGNSFTVDIDEYERKFPTKL